MDKGFRYKGVYYTSINDLSTSLSIPLSAINKLGKQYGDRDKILEHLDEYLESREDDKVFGKPSGNLPTFVSKYGLNSNVAFVLSKKMQNHEDIIREMYTGKATNMAIIYYGKFYRSLVGLAKDYNVTAKLVWNFIKQGASLDEAVKLAQRYVAKCEAVEKQGTESEDTADL